MESLSKQELISTITKQADQIKRYEARLKDVVTAYKGLIKEKEALENSLKALNNTESLDTSEDEQREESVATLTQALAALTEQKSRMEEAFQLDKRLTREKYESQLTSIREDAKAIVSQHFLEENNWKAKLAFEIQGREKERVDHAAMIKELLIKLSSERKSKEKLQDRVVLTNETQATQSELEKRVRDLSSSLEAAQRRLQRAESRTSETPAQLVRLQQKLALLEQSHAVAIREEQIKVKRAEESVRKICVRQEDRVVLLESKIAELSETVGQYDVRRRNDQQVIQQLKDSFNGRIVGHVKSNVDYEEQSECSQRSVTDNEKLADSEYLQTLIDKIHILKKELIAENEKLGNPIDIATVFKLEGYENIHLMCREEYEHLKLEFDEYKKQKVRDTGSEIGYEVEDLKREIAVLLEKLETYKMMYEEESNEKLDIVKDYEEKLKVELQYNKETTVELQNRVVQLEKQAATQRARFVTLLDETDSMLRTRGERRVSADEAVLADASTPPHMLHYAHELARKDLDISTLRKDKHNIEALYRGCQRNTTIEKERDKEIINALKQEIDKLRRSQSREGANLEYLKNVVLAFLVSRDGASRKHMLNAITAVLHFSDQEQTALSQAL